MRLLVVDHNAIEPTNRKLYGEMVRLGGVTLRLLVPSRWRNGLRELVFLAPSSPSSYELYACNVLFHTRTHRLIYRSLSRHVREFRPDIVYMNAEPENFQTWQAARLCSSTQTRLVFSSWRNIDHVKVGYPYRVEYLHRAIETYVLKRATHGVVFNRQAQRLYALHGFPATTYIPPPVDTDLFHPADSTGGVDDKFVVGYVGRLRDEKGVDLLLRALALLPDKCRAMIVGDGPARDGLRQLADELGIVHRVEFRPPVEQADLPQIYWRLHALVLPSRSTPHWCEQFGRVLVEAMACGIPVIGSNSGEIPQVIGDAGLIFRQGSVADLREKVRQLLDDPELRAELARKGRARVLKEFDLPVIAERLMETIVKSMK